VGKADDKLFLKESLPQTVPGLTTIPATETEMRSIKNFLTSNN